MPHSLDAVIIKGSLGRGAYGKVVKVKLDLARLLNVEIAIQGVPQRTSALVGGHRPCRLTA